MVVDKTGKMITARRYPHMIMIQPEILSSGHLVLSYPGKDKVTVDVKNIKVGRIIARSSHNL